MRGSCARAGGGEAKVIAGLLRGPNPNDQKDGGGAGGAASSFPVDTQLALAYAQDSPGDRSAAALLFPDLEALAAQLRKDNGLRSPRATMTDTGVTGDNDL